MAKTNGWYLKLVLAFLVPFLLAVSGAMALVWKNSMTRPETREEIEAQVPRLLKPLEEKVDQVSTEQAVQRAIMERMETKIDDLGGG